MPMNRDQLDLICTQCILRTCDEQSLHCQYRWQTNPNWIQKRKIANEKKKAGKRAAETGRTKYWREYGRKKRAERLLANVPRRLPTFIEMDLEKIDVQ